MRSSKLDGPTESFQAVMVIWRPIRTQMSLQLRLNHVYDNDISSFNNISWLEWPNLYYTWTYKRKDSCVLLVPK